MVKKFVLLLLASLMVACGKGQTTTAPSTTATSPATEVFASAVYPQGVSTQTFVAAQAGTISVALTTVGPIPTTALGLGLGVPNSTAPVCRLTITVHATAGPSALITAAADAGTYCVAVYDIGFVPASGASFSVSVVHP